MGHDHSNWLTTRTLFGYQICLCQKPRVVVSGDKGRSELAPTFRSSAVSGSLPDQVVGMKERESCELGRSVRASWGGGI